MSNLSRLHTIEVRQRHNRVRDLVFAAMVVIVGSASLLGVTHVVRTAQAENVAAK
ncbi:MAG TPA: hypothetical protein VGC41_01400 [Kofleriaceae bacterium]